MTVLLRSGQSALREEAVEEMKDCRSMTQNWCRSTVMPERGPSIFQDRLKSKSHTKLPKYPWTTRNPIYVFLSYVDGYALSIILFYCFLLGLERRSILLQRLIGTPLVLSLISLSIILFRLWFVLLILCMSNHLVRFRDFMSLMSNW